MNWLHFNVTLRSKQDELKQVLGQSQLGVRGGRDGVVSGPGVESLQVLNERATISPSAGLLPRSVDAASKACIRRYLGPPPKTMNAHHNKA